MLHDRSYSVLLFCDLHVLKVTSLVSDPFTNWFIDRAVHTIQNNNTYLSFDAISPSNSITDQQTTGIGNCTRNHNLKYDRLIRKLSFAAPPTREASDSENSWTS